MKQSLLVELNTEELPPKALKNLSEAFASGLAMALRDRQFRSDDSVVTAFGAPRRLAVHITHVLARSPDQPFRQKLMPLAVARDAAANWTHAFLKKLESLGRGHMARVPVGTHDGPDCLVVESDGKADSVFLQAVQPGQRLIVALQSALERTSGKRVETQYGVDTELMGGLVVRLGDTVYDGSVRRQLQRLRNRFVSGS